jgi:DNA-binding MarR family transcriptional regulator
VQTLQDARELRGGLRRGLVRRVGVPGNRRAVNVTVTPTGRELVHAARGSVRAEIAAMSESLGPAERDHLSSSATALIRGHAASHAIPL